MDLALPAFIEAEATAIAALLAALDAERSALVVNDAEALENATHDKLTATRQLERLEQERRQLCATFDVRADDAGFKSLLDPMQRRRWAGLLDDAAACRDLNVANGHLLRVRTRQVSASLNLLRGVDGNTSVYGPDGQCNDGNTRRSLVSA